jgi:hypothetical protein
MDTADRVRREFYKSYVSSWNSAKYFNLSYQAYKCRHDDVNSFTIRKTIKRLKLINKGEICYNVFNYKYVQYTRKSISLYNFVVRAYVLRNWIRLEHTDRIW